ncbi:MAG: cysteine desulfurase [Candidatus Peribacteraceae bacterium]
MALDLATIRAQFPILRKTIGSHPLIYLDNAATTQKPLKVLERIGRFYREQNANINRSMHALAEEATLSYEEARNRVARFIGASHSHEVIFTRNTTESINMVARSWGATLQRGDSIVLSMMEHHSNIVPWLQLKESRGINLRWIPVNREGTMDMDELKGVLSSGRVKLVSITGLSNVLGCLPPLREIARMAHRAGARLLVDGAQLVAHERVNVQESDIDFLAFSGHKLYGPSGVGVLYAKETLLERMPPFLGGGDMIQTVTTKKFTCADLPRKFEAGTPATADAVGLGEAIAWLEDTGAEAAHEHTRSLVRYAHEQLRSREGITILGPKNPKQRVCCVSFTVEGVHPHDLTDVLGQEGICLRAGHHCTQPLHQSFGITASTRLSVGVYNTKEEIDTCIEAIVRAKKMLNG